MGLSLKYKKSYITITNAFQIILDESNHKPNKTWVDKDSEFLKTTKELWLQDNEKETYSTHNEGKSIVSERFIEILKNKIYKYMVSISKNVYIDQFVDLINKYNNTHPRTIKMKPFNVKSSTCVDIDKKNNNEDLNFEVSDRIRISK